mgnify:CR=1 FL=1
MAQEIKLKEDDISYFGKILQSLEDIERRIAALEITKMDLYEQYKAAKEHHQYFTQQVKVKYEIDFKEAEVDIDRGVLIVLDKEEVVEKTEMKKEKKNSKKEEKMETDSPSS